MSLLLIQHIFKTLTDLGPYKAPSTIATLSIHTGQAYMIFKSADASHARFFSSMSWRTKSYYKGFFFLLKNSMTQIACLKVSIILAS